TQIIIHKTDSNIDSQKVYADITKPFAPGTYIELEAKAENLKANKSICWQTTLIAINNQTNKQEISNKTIQTLNNISYFYLSSPKEIDSYRQQGYTDFKYIIYASSINYFNQNTVHIIFNINFEVGDGIDSNVIESKEIRTDTTNKIYTLKQAVGFLYNTYKDYKNYQQKINSTLYEYYKTHPQIAGKIAYIYYRFDLSNKEFVESVEYEKQYIIDKNQYIQSIANTFNHQSYKPSIFKQDVVLFKVAYNNLFINYEGTNDLIPKREKFIKNFIEAICKNNNLPLKKAITFEKTLDDVVDAKEILAGYYENKIIKINMLNIIYGDEDFYDIKKYSIDKFDNVRMLLVSFATFKHLMNTIFHEIRHFYIEEKYINKNRSILQDYIWYSLYLYIPPNDNEGIFKEFYKICSDKESQNILYNSNNDSKNVGCILSAIESIYELQPSERDARYIAMQIMNELNL
ncbi:hypothetical protein, partial [Helicobacter saguini]